MEIFSLIWAASWQNKQNDCAPIEDSVQAGHLPSLIRVFAVRMKKPWVFSYPFSVQWRLWIQTGQMSRLIWVFAGRTHILLVLSCSGSYGDETKLLTFLIKVEFRAWIFYEGTVNQRQFTILLQHRENYHKIPKISDTRNPKIWTRWPYHRIMHPKDAEGILNGVKPDQTVFL